MIVSTTACIVLTALMGPNESKLVGSPSNPGDTVGFSVAMEGNTAVLGAYRRNYPGNGPNSGSLYVFQHDERNWMQIEELAASDGSGFDYLGWSVDIEGDVIAAGATWADEPTFTSGGVYIFRNNDGWEEEAIIAPEDLPVEANFGHSVDLSTTHLIVGAPFIDGAVNAQGAAYIFSEDGGAWTLETKLMPFVDGVNFAGASVAIDGNLALVGAPRDNTDGVSSGSVFVYQRDTKNNWLLLQRIVPDEPEAYSYFGNEVAIEGTTILVGAEYANNGGANVGAVYLFEYDNGTIQQTQMLSPNEGWSWSHFGSSIDIDGDTVAIGAYGSPQSTGCAYVYARNSDGLYEQTHQFAPSDGSFGNRFGQSIGVSGQNVVVGSPFAMKEQGAGYAYSVNAPFRGARMLRANDNLNQNGEVRLGLGFEYFGNFDGHDYFLTTESLEYYDAHEMSNVFASVIGRSANLVTVNSPEESGFIQSISTELMWIGYSDLAQEGMFAWDSGQPDDWTDWGGSEPNKNGGTEDVVVMNWAFPDGTVGWTDWKEQLRFAKALIEIDGEACQGDADFDHDVDEDDLMIMLEAWGDLAGPGDVNNDGVVNVTDLLWILGYWGVCP